MTPLRLASVLFLCALAAGQNEQKSAADFKKPFQVVANLIVDKNFFLLRELTAEEQETGKVNLEDPFNEKNRKTTTTPAPTTAAPTTRAPATRAPLPSRGLSFGEGIPGLLPPPPVPAAVPARQPSFSPRRPVGRFPPRTTTEAPETESTTTEATEAPTTARPLRRGGAARRKVVRIPVRAGSRRRTTTEAPATTESFFAVTEEPATTAAPTTTTEEPEPTTAAPRRGGSRRRQPVVNRRVVAVPAAPFIPFAPAAAPVAPAVPFAPVAADAAPAAAPPASRRRPASAAAPTPERPSLPPLAPAAVPRIPGTSRRRPVPQDERENEINELHRWLPGGSKSVLLDMPPSTFSCKDRPYGYYADMQANCQVFHICAPVVHADGFSQNLKHSLFCNNGTRFDQRTLTCREETLALPCEESDSYYASVKYFEKFNIFDRMRAEDERRRRKLNNRLETLDDVEALEAQLNE